MPKITKIKDNIITLSGKYKYTLYQNFALDEGITGFVLSAKEDSAMLLTFGDTSLLKINKIVKEGPKIFNVNLYEHYFGKIIDVFGKVLHPTNFKVPSKPKVIGSSELFLHPLSILERSKLDKPLDTGILTIDTMIPIGRGQRELIIGDRQTGKTTIALNMIINQKNDVKCIYVAIGQKRSDVINTVQILSDNNSLDNTIILYAESSSPMQQYIAPSTGMALAECIANQGGNAFIVIDDLSKHANICREISLSLGRSPGREAYPTDIFYQHSRLLERSGQFTEVFKNGSITCIPIVETVQEDIASLIPSNIISITDGQIFTSVDSFNNGDYPAINIQKSVSRTGSSVQSKILKKAASGLKSEHAMFSEIKMFSNMSIDISESLKAKMKKGNNLEKMLIQYGNVGYSRSEMMILIMFYEINEVNFPKNNKFSKLFSKFMRSNDSAIELMKKINEDKLPPELLNQFISKILGGFAKACDGDYSIMSKQEFKDLEGSL